MPVKAVKPYSFPAKDTVDKFPAPLLYIGWDEHLMFCAPHCIPVPPTTPFKALISDILPSIYSYHPDFAQIDWSRVEWLKSGKPFHPDMEKSMAENGLKHKDVIRFRTPGLRGIKGSCS
ncbi:phenol hydroxylase subunit P4 [Hydrogenophilus thermoluteolus]|nr:phenol hydroxylase subunit P4 [Hydrogenophilus thermoluteolus]MBW7656835.1 phenol hydroxylase subunit P4 [Hydrogenophilus thermoluteolus]